MPYKSIRGNRASGRFVLRIDPGLHAVLRRAAGELGLSLNDYCARKLAVPSGNVTAIEGATRAVERAAELFAERLVGIAVFGSWARGEVAGGSDLDILVVVEPRVRLTRRLYRIWDEAPIGWGHRTVEPHFVHLPARNETVAGIWAEVAVDGIVLFERGLALSTRLILVRQDIVSGRIVRRLVHGQPYWVEAA